MIKKISKFILPTIQYVSYPFIIAYLLNENIYSFNSIYDILTFIIINSIIIHIGWFAIYEIYYWVYGKNKLIEEFYIKLLCGGNFPNPWNYYFDDGITYFLDISSDESINTNIRLHSMKIYTEFNFLLNLGNLTTYNRMRYAMSIAIEKYFQHFKDSDQVVPNFKKNFNHKDSSRLPYVLFCLFS